MTKQKQLDRLEARIGALEVHARVMCNLPMLSQSDIASMSVKKLDAAITERKAWLKKQGEKERMGTGE
jgi:hypothetical protein